ncbi:hypothetical protein OUZ56_025914 [Daphnia magna]|uniref:Uncharacterized protein n=1 Tax=Daphnia magna TaxID=35525 RepID=A0ABQ9ZKC8_9CRUS|nr:hypothetical protein OUZ56_025914 [Daphnia magna]
MNNSNCSHTGNRTRASWSRLYLRHRGHLSRAAPSLRDVISSARLRGEQTFLMYFTDFVVFHVLNHCEEGLQLATKRHNTIKDLLGSLLVKQGHDVTINNAIPGQRIRPDVEFQLSGSRVMVDVVVCYDQPGSMENAYQRKYDKYSSHGRILPLVVGSLGSWYPRNDEIRSILGINGRSWGAFRFKARLAAIQPPNRWSQG